MKPYPRRAFDFATRQAQWAIFSQQDTEGRIHAPHLKRILDIASRTNEPDFEAVAQKVADRADESGILEIRGNVAVINITGPIFRYANLFTWISGATSIQELALAFRKAVDDDSVKAIVLNVDSPGGEVSGISELALEINRARDRKPVIAYADDLTASGAYWLASAAGWIVASDTAELGSIGVVGTWVVYAPAEGETAYQFVSSVSPKKRPDLASEEGKAVVQQRIDDLAAVFVSRVAQYRGVSVETVLSDFGQGGVLIASKAVAAGMADEIGTFEELIDKLKSGVFPSVRAAAKELPVASATISQQEVREMFVDANTAADAGQQAAASEMEKKKCSGCGAEMEPDWEFCPKCGQKQSEASEGPDAPAADAPADAVPAAPEAPAPEPPPTDPTATLEQARTEAYEHAVEIAEMCVLSGKANLAAGFIKARKSVAEVQAELQSARASETDAEQISSHVTGGAVSGTDPYKPMAEQRAKDKGISFHAAYQQVVAENPKLYEQYLATRQAIPKK